MVPIVVLIFVAALILHPQQVICKRQEGEKRLKDEFISGHAYQRQANWSFCNRQPINFVPELIRDNDIVFINTDMFSEAMLLLRKNRMDLETSSHPGKFIAIFGNSDVTFSQDNYEAVVTYVKAIYAVNSACNKQDCPLLTTIPIGFVDYPDMGYSHLFMKLLSAEEYGKKRNLLYMNYRTETNVEARTACTNAFLKQPSSGTVGEESSVAESVIATGEVAKQRSRRYQHRKEDFPQWVVYEEGLDRTDFFAGLIRSKYVLVPRGNGLDTHRVYESMYFNAIPIVLTGQFDHFYEHLPVLIVQSWSEINEEYLRLNYVKLRVRLTNWKRTNSHWKRVDFWLPDLKQYKRKRRKQARREASHNDRNETIGIDGSSKGDKLRGGAKREEEDDDDT